MFCCLNCNSNSGFWLFKKCLPLFACDYVTGQVESDMTMNILDNVTFHVTYDFFELIIDWFVS